MQEVLDKIKSTSYTSTVKFLIAHESCTNLKENSIKSALTRVREKVALLRKTSRPSGKEELDAYLNGPFPFPEPDQSTTRVKP